MEVKLEVPKLALDPEFQARLTAGWKAFREKCREMRAAAPEGHVVLIDRDTGEMWTCHKEKLIPPGWSGFSIPLFTFPED